jgi:hypothetical protein
MLDSGWVLTMVTGDWRLGFIKDVPVDYLGTEQCVPQQWGDSKWRASGQKGKATVVIDKLIPAVGQISHAFARKTLFRSVTISWGLPGPSYSLQLKDANISRLTYIDALRDRQGKLLSARVQVDFNFAAIMSKGVPPSTGSGSLKKATI